MRKPWKRVTACLAALAMCGSLLLDVPAGTFRSGLSVSAAESDGIQTALDISQGNITIGEGTLSGYAADGSLLTEADPDGYRITGTSTEYTVTVSGGTHAITLDNAAIDASGTGDILYYVKGVPALAVEGAANAALTLSGTNTLTGGAGRAGLYVASDASLTIDGEGSLDAEGSTGGAGIGADLTSRSGAITINSGTITAKGSCHDAHLSSEITYAAGIGGSSASATGTITINGGTITASAGGAAAADIGSGCTFYGEEGADYTSADATVIIQGGNIHANTIGVGRDNTSTPAPTATVQNRAGEDVSLQTFALLAAADGTDVSGGTGFPADFSFAGVATIENKLYCWLPEGTEVTAITAGGNAYTTAGNNAFLQDGALTADPVANLSDGNIVLSAEDGVLCYTVGDGEKQYYAGSVTITDGTSTTNSITVASGTHAVILDSVAISPNYAAAIALAADTALHLTLIGENILTGSADPNSDQVYAGIYVPKGASLTIDGTGSLTATGGSSRYSEEENEFYVHCAAGIGGDGRYLQRNAGKITIAGGTVTAVAGTTNGRTASAIGGGYYEYDEEVTYSTCEGVSIQGGVVTAAAVQNLTQTGGILLEDGNATVKGENTLTTELTIASGKIINFVDGASITNPELLQLADDAIVQVDGMQHVHNMDGAVSYTNITATTHTSVTACLGCPVGGKTTGTPEPHSTTADDDRAADCHNRAYCSVCASEYGTTNTANLNPDCTVENGFYSCGAYQPAVLNKENVYEIGQCRTAVLVHGICQHGRRQYQCGCRPDGGYHRE